jgi:hypothetical protein
MQAHVESLEFRALHQTAHEQVPFIMKLRDLVG